MIVESNADVDMTVYAKVRKRCPYVQEPDIGAAHIAWTVSGKTLELHALREWLDTWQEQRASHELFTESVAAHLTTQLGSTVTVKTYWQTAGMSITVTAR